MDSQKLSEALWTGFWDGAVVGFGALLHTMLIASPWGWIILGLLLIGALLPATKRRRAR